LSKSAEVIENKGRRWGKELQESLRVRKRKEVKEIEEEKEVEEAKEEVKELCSARFV